MQPLVELILRSGYFTPLQKPIFFVAGSCYLLSSNCCSSSFYILAFSDRVHLDIFKKIPVPHISRDIIVKLFYSLSKGVSIVLYQGNPVAYPNWHMLKSVVKSFFLQLQKIPLIHRIFCYVFVLPCYPMSF